MRLAVVGGFVSLAMLLVSQPAPREQVGPLPGGGFLLNSGWRLQPAGRQVALDSTVFPLQYKVFVPREDTILHFPGGLIGFSALKAFRLFEPADGYPLKFLQSVEREDISFTCIDVGAFKPDYTVPMGETDAQALAIEDPGDALILALVTVPKDPSRMTANLAGPLVVNIKTLQARQIVLNIDQFPLAYPLFPGK